MLWLTGSCFAFCRLIIYSLFVCLSLLLDSCTRDRLCLILQFYYIPPSLGIFDIYEGGVLHPEARRNGEDAGGVRSLPDARRTGWVGHSDGGEEMVALGKVVQGFPDFYYHDPQEFKVIVSRSILYSTTRQFVMKKTKHQLPCGGLLEGVD